MTFDIWSEATKKVIQRSAIRTADPSKGGFPNLRVSFHEDQEPDKPQIVEPNDLLDKPGLMCPPQNHTGTRTRKHKVKWHDAAEAPEDYADEFSEFKDAESMPTPSEDQIDQSAHTERRRNPQRSCRKVHLIAASACLSLASHIPIIDSGCNLFNLESKHVSHENPFVPESKYHILETRMEDHHHDLNHEVFIRKMQLQYFDVIKGFKR